MGMSCSLVFALLVAAGAPDGTVHVGPELPAVVPPRAGPPGVLAAFDAPANCLAWSADGRRVAAGAPDGTVHVIDAATGKAKSFTTFKDDAVTAVALSPDGQVLA